MGGRAKGKSAFSRILFVNGENNISPSIIYKKKRRRCVVRV